LGHDESLRYAKDSIRSYGGKIFSEDSSGNTELIRENLNH